MKTTKLNIRNDGEICHIDIEGTIGVAEESQFATGSSCCSTYERFKAEVERIGNIEAQMVVVNIRSTGGDVNDALMIYEALRQLDAVVVTRCYGYTASAATVIAQAAAEGCRCISASSLYLVHESSCAAEGNAAQMEACAEMLRKTDNRIASIYAARSGRDIAEFAALMGENGGCGRWLSPEEVVAAGLADEVMDAGEKTSPVRGMAQGIRRLLAAIGIGSRTENTLPSDINILHMGSGGEQNTAISVIEADSAAIDVRPTRTREREDPSTREVRRSANERAYADDAARMSAANQ